ncbi:MAG: GNAT family N-acetyltransferase [Flavobacteriales bacterium]|nr:GNAT family N-acetyltransferase [Flavobacteriales bacterium]
MINTTMLRTEIEVKRINAKETISVRQPVLRKGKAIEDCIFDGDDLPTTFHLGLFSNNILVGVATYLENNNPLFPGDHLQLRGMAILEEYQGKKLGEILLNKAETEAISRNKNIIWCNARFIAVNFYKRAGYQIIGDSFEIKDIGTHFVMYKEI